jgi:hypothetical protein
MGGLVSDFEVDAKAYTGAADALGRLDALAAAALGDAVDELGASALAAVRARARRHRQTGALESLITREARAGGFAGEVRIHAGGPIAPIIVGGSRPHVIEAMKGRALGLRSSAGSPVERFARRVRHPGTRPDPFVAAGMEDAISDAPRTLAKAGERVTGDLVDDIQRRA